jgi:hypothetical protein
MVLSALAALLTTAAHADSPQQVLRLLGTDLTAIRASKSPQRVTLQQLPDVRPLVGVSRQAVLSQLGEPDSCVGGSEAECLQSPAWNYTFYHLPPDQHGGGPELMLLFNQHSGVRDAQWGYAR